MTIRAAFFGTPAAAVPTLAALAQLGEVALVVTRADRRAGRSRTLRTPPVKDAAAEWGFPLAQPARVAEVEPRLSRLDIDVAVLAAYGQIIPPALLAVPRHGFVNVHFSLLPRWRGAAPVQRAILAGDEETGVSLMQMDAGLDTGPVLATRATPIGPAETAGALTARLATLGADLVATHLPAYLAGRLEAQPQDDAPATAAPMLTTAEARLDPGAPVADLARRVRAYQPRPGAWVSIEAQRLKVLSARVPQDLTGAPVPAGTIAPVAGRVCLGAADGALELLTVQPAGKPAMAAADWMNGRRGRPAVIEG